MSASSLVFLLAFAAGQPDARELVRKALAAWDASQARLEQYVYVERDEARELDDHDQARKVTSRTHELRMLEGSPYRRLLERDGKPLPANEKELQDAFLKDNTDKRKKESKEERAKRIGEWEHKRDRFKVALREIPDAFDFQLAGEETLNGRKVWVVAATPKKGYEPKDRYARPFSELNSRLWIDQQENQLVKMTSEARDVISIGLILVRIAAGSRAEVVQERLADGTWAPKRIWYRISARIGLFRKFHIEDESLYWGYHRSGQM
ncbi:MAG: hypothetical protein ABI693_22695 [Bryobacteraceae bacterium]